MPWIEKEGRTVDEARAAALTQLGLPADEAEVEVIREGARGLFGFGGEAALVRVRARSEAPDYRSAFHDRPADQAAPTPAPMEDSVRAAAPDAAAPAAAPPAPAESDDEPVVAHSAASIAPGAHVVAAQAPAVVVGDESPSEEDAAELAERQRVAAEVGLEMVNGIIERMGLKGEVTTRTGGSTVYVEVFGDEMGILIGRGGRTLEALQEVVRAGVQRRLKARVPVVVDVESYWDRRKQSRSGGGGRRRNGGGNR